MVNHVRNIMVLISQVVELQDAVVACAAVLTF
jgi:hypothetical protein